MKLKHTEVARRLWMGLDSRDVATTIESMKQEAETAYKKHGGCHMLYDLPDGGTLFAYYNEATGKVRFEATEPKHPPVIYMILQQENRTGQYSVVVMRGKAKCYQSNWRDSAQHAVNVAADFVKKNYAGWTVRAGESTLLLQKPTHFSRKRGAYA